MTPEEFKAKVQELILTWNRDPENGHGRYDELIEKLLIELGYEEGVKLVQDQTFWYA